MRFDNAYQDFRSLFRGGLVLLAVSACGASGGEDAEAGGLSIEAALAAPTRPADDLKDDALRKPADVLAFTGVDEGDVVFEAEAGPGYYTELLSKIVGPSGRVIMHNPPPFHGFVKDEIAARLAENRLANVAYVVSNFDALEAEDASVDLVTWFLGPHELYYRPPGVETFGDVEGSYAEIFRILKPGGIFVILDHAAPAGSPETSGNDLHRIDPAIVKGLAEGAGFEFVEESDILANPDDQYDLGVFDAAVRRKTDRFLLKYRKPDGE